MENEKTAIEPEEKKIKRPKILLAIIAWHSFATVVVLLLLIKTAFTESLDSLFIDSNIVHLISLIFIIIFSFWHIVLMWKLHVNALYISAGLLILGIFQDGFFGLGLIELAICIYLFNLRVNRVLLSTKEKEYLLPAST